MGKSNQSGWVGLRGKKWYGYFRRTVLDPKTETSRVDIVCVQLGLKSKVTKSAAREALRMEVAKQTGQNLGGGRLLKDSSTTFEWFVRNRYFPLRQGDWQPETAKEKMAQIEIDLIEKFGELPLESIDRFMLQTHVNQLADRYNPDPQAEDSEESQAQGQACSELGTTLADLASTARRDRLLLMLDMTAALRPSELFALRWRSFDSCNTLSITETVYRGVIRPFGKTKKSLGKVHLPDGLAHELLRWKTECRDTSPDAFIFQNADGGILRVDNYRERVLKPLAQRLGLPKLNFQILRRTMATQAQNMGSVKDIQAHLRHAKADTTANEYMQELPESVQDMVGSVYLMLAKGGDENSEPGDLQQKATKSVHRTISKLLKGLVGTAGFEPTTSTV
jgi:integrase